MRDDSRRLQRLVAPEKCAAVVTTQDFGDARHVSGPELALAGLAGRLQQALQFVQMPDAVGLGQLTGGFDVGGSVFLRQLQKALQNPDALRSAILDHRLSPLTGVRADLAKTLSEEAWQGRRVF